MPKIKFRTCESGEKGEFGKEVISKAIGKFFRCGVEKIQQACNNRRDELLKDWDTMNPNEKMLKYGLSDTTFQQGKNEFTDPFELKEPEIIVIDIFERKLSSINPDRPAETQSVSPPEIYFYLHNFFYENNSLLCNLMFKNHRMTLEEIVYHELLHACGDYKSDGVLRHNEIGIWCVEDLLSSGSQ